MIPRIVFVAATLVLCIMYVDCETCQVMGGGSSSSSSSSNTTDGFLTCPGTFDPENYTSCCYDYENVDIDDDYLTSLNRSETVEPYTNGSDSSSKLRRPRCCEPTPEDVNFLDWVLSLDPRICRVSMIVALSVTGTMLLFTIIIIICCFWSKCPLYTMCRVKYDKDDIIATAQDEETANLTDMPAEEKDGVKAYAPNEVKVTTLNEEEEPCLKKEKEQEEEQPLVEKKDGKKEDKKKEDKKKEEKKKEEKKKEEKKKEEKKKEEKKKEEKKKEDKKKEDKKKDEKKKDEKKEEKEEEKPVDNKEEKKEEIEENKTENEEKEKEVKEETKEEK